MVKKLFRLFGSFFSLLRIDILLEYLSRIDNQIYSGYKTRSMAGWKNGAVLHRPVILVGKECIKLGKKISIGKRCVITAWKDESNNPEIIINDYSVIGDDCHITSYNKIVIGKSCLLGKKITITDNSHGETSWQDLQIHPMLRKTVSKGAVYIGDRVWIGDKATILPNVKIGNGAIIGANSVVTKDVPENSIVAGDPAKVVKSVIKLNK